MDSIINILTELKGGELALIGSRPSVGKTFFAINILKNIIVNQNKSACFFSLEMSKIFLEKRFSEINFNINNNLLHIIDKPNQTITEIKEIIKSKPSVNIFFIDYLGLIANDEKQNIEEIVRELKSFALEMDVVIIALMQISREQNNLKPEIQQFTPFDNYADLIIGLYKNTEIVNNKIENIILKK